jgi:hypothetical protein
MKSCETAPVGPRSNAVQATSDCWTVKLGTRLDTSWPPGCVSRRMASAPGSGTSQKFHARSPSIGNSTKATVPMSPAILTIEWSRSGLRHTSVGSAAPGSYRQRSGALSTPASGARDDEYTIAEPSLTNSRVVPLSWRGKLTMSSSSPSPSRREVTGVADGALLADGCTDADGGDDGSVGLGMATVQAAIPSMAAEMSAEAPRRSFTDTSPHEPAGVIHDHPRDVAHRVMELPGRPALVLRRVGVVEER